MKKIIGTLALVAISLSYSCKDTKKEVKDTSDDIESNMDDRSDEMDNTMEEKTMTISLEPKSDSEVNGEVTFTEKDGEVMMVTKMSGLSSKENKYLFIFKTCSGVYEEPPPCFVILVSSSSTPI